MFESNTFVFRDLKKSLREIIAEEKGMVTLNSQFKSIDIRDISDNYRFIGGKEQCAEFIKKSLAFMPQERCVNKQSIDGFSHICISTDNVDVFQTGYIA